MNAGLDVPMEQDIGEVSSVVNDDVTGLENLQMADGAEPFVGMRGEVEIEGQLGFQLVEATEQALRIVGGLGGSGVAASEQFPGQIDPGAIDGKEPMAEPQVARGIGGVGGEDFLVGALEDGFVELLPGRAERGGRDAAFLRQVQTSVSRSDPRDHRSSCRSFACFWK